MESVRILTKKCVSLAGVLLILLMTGCGHSGRQKEMEQKERALPVGVTVVEPRLLSLPLRETGQLTAKSQIRLSFKTGGIIAAINVDDGAVVHKGDRLASLDLGEIKAHVNEAELAYKKAVRDYKRVENLYRDSVATLEQLEHIRTARDIAYNNLRIARYNLQHSVIRAPADGKILRRLAEAGEMVAPGYPILLFASTDKAWVVRCHVPDRDIVLLRPGDTATASFDAWPGRTFTGMVSETGTAADPYTNTFEVEITLDPSDIKLVAGLIANVKIWPAGAKKVIAIPYRALHEGDRMQAVVWLVKNGRAVLTEVNLQGLTDSLLVTGSGLKPGDTLVTEGLQDLVPGVPVKIIRVSRQ